MPRPKKPLEITAQVAQLMQGPQESALKLVCQKLVKSLACQIASIYTNSDDGHTLLANAGFKNNHSGSLILKKGRGLVSHIANTKQTLCLSEATSHLSFYYVHGLGEEKYHGFIGTPILREGSSVGVLIFQYVKKLDATADDIALIETVAQQISHLVIPPKEDKDPKNQQENSRVMGRGASSGMFSGQVITKLIMEDSLEITAQQGKGYQEEKSRLHQAHQQAKSFLEDLKSNATTKETEEILSAHLMMLADPRLQEKEDVHLKNNFSAEQAVTMACTELADMLKNISDPYIQQRSIDIIDVGRRVYHTLQPSTQSLNECDRKKVCIANRLPPSVLIEEGPKRFGALILVEENMYSHNIILAKSMNIPTVIISKEQLEILSDCNEVFVDGEIGLVVPSPEKQWLERYTQSHNRTEDEHHKDFGPCITKGGTLITLGLNGGFIKDTEDLPKWIPEIGLFRTEFQFFTSRRLPTEKDLTEQYTRVLKSANGRPTTLRILDAGADKQPPCLHFVHEDNPVLGDRSIRYLRKNSDIIFAQLRAMLRAQAATKGKLKILIPMVTVYEEVSRIRDHVVKVIRDLRREGLNVKMPPIGAMIEVPSCINLIPKMSSMLDFYCVGTNDLLQYYVAVDRTNKLVQYLYRWQHPAFLLTLKGIFKSCGETEQPVSICGEMAGEMWGALVLVGLGFRSLSMDRNAIPRHYELFAHASVKSLERLVNRLILYNTGLEVLEQLQLHLDKWKLPKDLHDLLQSELNNMINPS
jgi:phosphotransferase system enzyme I (PtsP)